MRFEAFNSAVIEHVHRAAAHPYAVAATDTAIAGMGFAWPSIAGSFNDVGSEFLLWGGVTLLLLRLLATAPAAIAGLRALFKRRR